MHFSHPFDETFSLFLYIPKAELQELGINPDRDQQLIPLFYKHDRVDGEFDSVEILHVDPNWPSSTSEPQYGIVAKITKDGLI